MRRHGRSGVTDSRQATSGGTTGGLRVIDDDRSAPNRDERAAARTRRRFARRQWRRRWLTWKPVLVVVLSLAVSGTAVWLVFFSSVLAVDEVRVTGSDTVSAQQVRTLAEVKLGRPLARVQVGRIESRVGSLAAVKSVQVSRHWPHRLDITIEERVPVAVVQIGGQLRALDADGVVFGAYDAPPAGLPVVQSASGASTDALREAATVVSTLPSAVSRRVDHVEVQTVDQISLVLKDGRRVEWGSAEDSAEKAEVLTVLLRQPASVYDVSVPGQPTTR